MDLGVWILELISIHPLLLEILPAGDPIGVGIWDLGFPDRDLVPPLAFSFRVLLHILTPMPISRSGNATL